MSAPRHSEKKNRRNVKSENGERNENIRQHRGNGNIAMKNMARNQRNEKASAIISVSAKANGEERKLAA